MQLSAEETLCSKPANYIGAGAAGFKVVCVQICLIAFVFLCEVFIYMLV